MGRSVMMSDFNAERERQGCFDGAVRELLVEWQPEAIPGCANARFVREKSQGL